MSEPVTLLEMLQAVADEAFERWDKDMRSGKLLTALSGRITNYDPRVTAIRSALADHAANLARIAELEAALRKAEIEIREAADKMHVLRLNHPGGKAHLEEDRNLMLQLSDRFTAAALIAQAALRSNPS